MCILHKAVHDIAKISDKLDRLYGFKSYSDWNFISFAKLLQYSKDDELCFVMI